MSVLDNHRARRAYARAGFVEERAVETDDRPAVLMLLRSGPARCYSRRDAGPSPGRSFDPYRRYVLTGNPEPPD
jgi:hypothetical protein